MAIPRSTGELKPCVYDWRATYEANYDRSPISIEELPAPVAGSWDYCGLRVSSPLAVAAGPLLNGRWVLYYASLGFDVLTYKTVRSRPRASYPLPNLQPVAVQQMHGGEASLPACERMRGSWAVSFGMPSRPVEQWQADVQATRDALPDGKLLSVSVVASPEADWTLDRIAADFADCARRAIDHGADCVEANFSCPNVASADGQLFQQPRSAGIVAASLREAVGKIPLVIKIGHITDESLVAELCSELAPAADALAMVNCIAAPVVDARTGALFDGAKRGIAGTAIRDAAIQQITLFKRVIDQQGFALRLIGVGGISTYQDVVDHLTAGSHAVQIATAAMIDPHIALKIRQQWPQRPA